MCGIWALISKNSIIINKNIKSKLLDFETIKKRGPDKTTLQIYDKYVLGFHRLAIHDLTPIGDQPFTFINNEDKKIYHLIVNGEIYNYKDLIKKYDMKLKSNSDCEVIYHLFKIKNNILETVKELNGEYAFILIINDIINDDIIIHACRDPIGVRPLFFGFNDNEVIFSSLLSGLCDHVYTNDCVFPPGKIMSININRNNIYYEPVWTTFYNILEKMNLETNNMNLETNNMNLETNNMYYEITNRLIKAVQIRLDSDRPIGALLSGGLDSSLICGIISKILKVDKLQTFSIGMNHGTDLKYADKVSKHINSNHTEILFTVNEGLEAIDKVIETTETWDITTIRASVGQYLLGKYISNNTDIKVILNGDGADEVEMGYLYFYLAPDKDKAQTETIKLCDEIHRYDGLRVDRCISNWGLEARIPFLDINFVDYYLNINPELKIPTKTRMEKQLIRDAFNTLYPDILPNDVIYRKKEAFSDGVSSKEKSWFEIIQEWIEIQVSDEEYKCNKDETIKSKEAYYYKKKFREFFCKKYEHDNIIHHYWLPNWIKTNNEPSARILEVYK